MTSSGPGHDRPGSPSAPDTGATVILAPTTITSAVFVVEVAGGGLPIVDATIEGIQIKALSGKSCVEGSNSDGLTLRGVTAPR